MVEKYHHTKFIMKCFLGEEKMKTNEDKKMVKLAFFSSKTAVFRLILKKKSTQSLFDAWSFLLVHIRFSPSEEPKNFVNCIL